MKKKFISIILTLALCVCLAASALASETISQISIQIPGSDAVFTLENVSAEYVIVSDGDLPVYRFSLPGNTGKLTCDSAANVTYNETWLDPGETEPNMGGGGPLDPLEPGWSDRHPPSLEGSGITSVWVTVYNDGTLISGDGKAAVARIEFYFGEPLTDMFGTWPDDLISWQWQYMEREIVDLPKHPISALSASDGTTPPATLPGTIDTIDSAAPWARDSILSAIGKGFVPSELQSNYSDVITRAEFARLAVSYLEFAAEEAIADIVAERGDPEKLSHTFSDTSDSFILAAYRLGIISGTRTPADGMPGTFDPGGQFTREQAATMLMNLCRVLDIEVDNAPDSGFSDINLAASWAIGGINFVRAQGYMVGSGGNFNPRGTYTRQESIMMFDNMGND